MGPILLTHLVSALARQLTHLSQHSSTAGRVHRCLSAFTSAPSRGLLVPSRATSLQAPSPGAPTQGRSSLLGQCQHLACLQPSSAGMKTKSALKLRCQDCFFVRRRGRLFVFCKTHPRHKQRQG